MQLSIPLPAPVPLIFSMAWIGLFMFIGIILRAKIPFLRRYLIPAAISGGLVGTVANWFLLNRIGIFGVDMPTINAISFHIFPLFFSALSLRPQEDAGAGPRIFMGGLWLAATFTGIPAVLYIVSMFTAMGCNTIFSTDYMASFSMLIANGFINGPGASLPMGIAWDNHLNAGLGLAQLGLTGGSIGFLVAYAVGIPMANFYHKRSKLLDACSELGDDTERRGYYIPFQGCGAPSIGNETTHNSNVDSLAFHIGIIIFNYALGLALCIGIAEAISHSTYKNYVGVIWLFAWIAPVITGTIIRTVLKKTGYSCLLDAGTLSHLSNTFIDIMVMCSFFGMALNTLSTYLPLIVSVSITLTTTLYITSKFQLSFINNFRDVRMLYLMGTLTGTAATGLFLCRIIDPDGKSPIAFEQAVAPVFIAIVETVTAPILHFEVLGGNSPWMVIQWLAVKALVCCAAIGIFTVLLNKVYKNTSKELMS